MSVYVKLFFFLLSISYHTLGCHTICIKVTCVKDDSSSDEETHSFTVNFTPKGNRIAEKIMSLLAIFSLHQI